MAINQEVNGARMSSRMVGKLFQMRLITPLIHDQPNSCKYSIIEDQCQSSDMRLTDRLSPLTVVVRAA